MDHSSPESRRSTETHESETSTFVAKLRDLLPNENFEETAELVEARTAVLEALAIDNPEPGLLRDVWTEYASLWERLIDAADPQLRARLQISSIVHKALIFREAGNIERYAQDLNEAGEYAYNMYLDEIATAIKVELRVGDTE